MSETSEHERIVRRAEAMGLDGAQVARALDTARREQPRYQALEEMQRPSWFRRKVTRRFARPS